MRNSARRRKMNSITFVTSEDIIGLNGDLFPKRRVRLGRMNGNLRTALFYLFALVVTWFLFCCLTFVYFTSSNASYRDNLHPVQDESNVHYGPNDSGEDEAHVEPINNDPKDTEEVRMDIQKEAKSLDENGHKGPAPPSIPPVKEDKPPSAKYPLPKKRSPCGLCPDDDQNQLDYMVLAVQKYLRQKKNKPVDTEIPSESIAEPDVPTVVDKAELNITKAAIPSGGSQLRVLLHTTDKIYLFKPEITNETVGLSPRRDHCRVRERYAAELAAYYLSLMIPIVNVPNVVGFRLDLAQVWPHRDRFFKERSWIGTEMEMKCFRGTCSTCRKPACTDNSDMLKGALSLWTPTASFEKLENPWSENCTKRGTELWRQNADFCHNSRHKEKYSFFKTSTDSTIGLLRLIDTAIFDYLIDFPNRHFLHYSPTASSKGFILFQNGKSFSSPDHSDMAILAPLFQCCEVDKNTWKLLRRLTLNGDPRIGDAEDSKFYQYFRKLMAKDPLYPFIKLEHIHAVERRLRKVTAVIEMCIEEYGADAVLRTYS